MASVADHLVGVPQSRYTGYAILAAIIAVALSILFGKEQVSLSRRVVVIVVMFLMALPTILLVLFQINCLVSGTSKGPYCGWYAWLVAAIAIVYCILLVIVAVTAKAYDSKADKIEKFGVSFTDANMIAGSMLSKIGVESFEDIKKPAVAIAPEVASEKIATVEKSNVKKDEKKDEKKEPFVVKKKSKFTDGPEPDKKEKEGFADYSYGAAPVDETANMYML